jgi:hypothetical protein
VRAAGRIKGGFFHHFGTSFLVSGSTTKLQSSQHTTRVYLYVLHHGTWQEWHKLGEMLVAIV